MNADHFRSHVRWGQHPAWISPKEEDREIVRARRARDARTELKPPRHSRVERTGVVLPDLTRYW